MEVHGVLDLARRELASSRDENAILRNELSSLRQHLQTYRENGEKRTEQIHTVQVEFYFPNVISRMHAACRHCAAALQIFGVEPR